MKILPAYMFSAFETSLQANISTQPSFCSFSWQHFDTGCTLLETKGKTWINNEQYICPQTFGCNSVLAFAIVLRRGG